MTTESMTDARAAGHARRSCLTVPGSSARFLAKARSLHADEVILDLEDSCAPLAKPQARADVVAALNEGGWAAGLVAVRINDVTTPWAYRDVVAVVEHAGRAVDAIVLPKVQDAGHVRWLDLTLTQIELAMGFPVGRIAIEAQIEDARALARAEEIAASSPRLAALVFGPADFMASLGMRTLVAGEQPRGYEGGDAYHYALMRLLVAARAHGLQAIDGPYVQIDDPDGFRRVAGRSAALGLDGKWVVHPSQISAANEVFAPTAEEAAAAQRLLDAYDASVSEAGGARGAVRHGDSMIDEASRKLARTVAAKAAAARAAAGPSGS